jgi:hypothetical protein
MYLVDFVANVVPGNAGERRERAGIQGCMSGQVDDSLNSDLLVEFPKHG